LINGGAYAVWGLAWFASFSIMISQWNKTDNSDAIESSYGKSAINNIKAAITFTFFNVLIWVS